MPWEYVGGHDSTVLGEGLRAMPSSTVWTGRNLRPVPDIYRTVMALQRAHRRLRWTRWIDSFTGRLLACGHKLWPHQL